MVNGNFRAKILLALPKSFGETFSVKKKQKTPDIMH